MTFGDTRQTSIFCYCYNESFLAGRITLPDLVVPPAGTAVTWGALIGEGL